MAQDLKLEITKTYRESDTMKELLKKSPPVVSPKPGEVLDGTVLFKGKNKIIIDLSGVATGIISGRELRDSFNTFQTLAGGIPVSWRGLVMANEQLTFV